MKNRALLTLALLLNILPSETHGAGTNPATGMYSPDAKAHLGGETCSGPDSSAPSRFYATAECDYTCQNDSEKHSGTRELEWDPEKEAGMFKGDGNLWATMTQRLTLKGKRTCMEAAAIGCRKFDRVASVQYRGLTSGAWNMPAQVLCGPGQPLNYSPYDSSLVGGLHRHPESAQAGVTLIGELVSDAGTDRKMPMPKDCQKKITASVCFGDCLCEPAALAECPHRGKDQGWAQVLGTSKPPATRTITMCADALVAEFAKNEMQEYARDVLQYYCEDYAWRTIFARKAVGTTCSAYRGTIDCSSIF